MNPFWVGKASIRLEATYLVISLKTVRTQSRGKVAGGVAGAGETTQREKKRAVQILKAGEISKFRRKRGDVVVGEVPFRRQKSCQFRHYHEKVARSKTRGESE